MRGFSCREVHLFAEYEFLMAPMNSSPLHPSPGYSLSLRCIARPRRLHCLGGQGSGKTSTRLPRSSGREGTS